MPHIETIPLHETARSRYLNYALSVITSRALPDVRDGLKPVQRRILYAMFASLRLYPDARYRKSATIVGDVMGKYHPHGDTAIYDAMVRLAQDFSLRDPLVEGHGNFGSVDGDSPAAMRYTEARLRSLAMEMLEELRQDTVPFRPNFDGSLSEPVVLPSKFPNLLVNGATGIAVGMATSIPPHNLSEVIGAAIYLVDARLKERANWNKVRVQTLVRRHIRGPDFPTGGQILNTPEELVDIYKKGEGSITVRGEYRVQGARRVIITSIPYAVTKSTLVEKIADHIARERVPQLSDIRDESTDEVRIVLELKRGARAEAAMAYLFRHTPLQTRFHCNLTCLVPTGNPLVCAPDKLDLPTMLRYFLNFRLDVVTRRLRHELEQLNRRIHILEGFEIIFDALDEAVKIIRSSMDRKDADQRLRHRFGLTELQSEAVLDARLYKLAQLEILAIREELEAKRKRAEEIARLLEDEPARWLMVRGELKEIREAHGSSRRTVISGPANEAYEYSSEDFIVDEDTYVMVTREGWIKRQRSYADLESIRIREGDELGWVLAGRTRNTVVLFTNYGRAYTVRLDQVPSTTGYGVPLQKLFGFSDRERVVGAISCDSRILPKVVPDPELFPEGAVLPDYGFLVAFSRQGMVLRLALDAYAEPSLKAGRLYMRLKDGDEVLVVQAAGGLEHACVASKQGYALIFPVQQVTCKRGAAMGVMAMRLGKEDYLLGATLSTQAREGLVVETNRGREDIVRTTKYPVTNRAADGHAIIRQGYLARVIPKPVEVSLPQHK